MNRPMARTLGALALAAALATSSTAAFAATSTGSPALHAGKTTKKRVDTLVGLDRKLAASAVRQAYALKAEEKPPQAGPTEKDLDEVCGEWFIIWEQDADGNPIPGTYELYCDGSTIPLPLD
jgi:hypothetical protein